MNKKEKFRVRFISKLMEILGIEAWEITRGANPNRAILIKMADLAEKFKKENKALAEKVNKSQMKQSIFEKEYDDLKASTIAENNTLKQENKSLQVKIIDLKAKIKKLENKIDS